MFIYVGITGHVEVYDCKFKAEDGKSLNEMYRELVKFFFQFHDPTTGNRQGNDKGTQYASVIYCTDEEQKRIATEVKNELQVGKFSASIYSHASTFYVALINQYIHKSIRN